MTIQRKLIRQAIADRLKGETAAGVRVYPGRVDRIDEAELPAIAVLTPGETVTEENESPRTDARILRVYVEVFCRRDAANPVRVDNQLDDVCEQAEQALRSWILSMPEIADSKLTLLRDRTRLDQVDTDIEEEGRVHMAAGRLTYSIGYLTAAAGCDPADLFPFETIHADYDLPPPDGTLEASDVIPLEQPEPIT